MKAVAAKSPIGVFVFSAEGELIYYKLFSPEPSRALQEYENSEKIELEGYQIANGGERILKKRLREYAVSLGFAKDENELNDFLNKFCILYSKKRLVGKIKRDRILIQASNSLEELRKTANLYVERLYEWYTLHYPESKHTQRQIVDLILSKDTATSEIPDEDGNILLSFAKIIYEIEKQKKNTENYVSETAKEIMPNTCSLMDPLLVTRLLALAGSLEKMSKMTASSIQLLGAEKALFRHLKKQGKSPKYGIIFIDPRIQSAPADKKGKVARILASYLMKATRIDYYSGRKEPSLKEDMEKELKGIR